jgi:hemolysin activation/secretion protein
VKPRRAALWILCVIGAAATLGAQTDLPGPAQPAQIKAELERAAAAPPAPLVMPAAPREPSATAPDASPRFVLRAVEILGAKRYAREELAKIFSAQIDRPVTLQELEKLTARITARYRGDGYLLAQAILPAQEIRDGVVRIQVVEGFIDKVEERGAALRWTPLTRALAAGMVKNRPVSVSEVEGALLLIDDLPGLEVHSVLAASPTSFGAARASLELEHQPVNGFLSLDNRGSRFVGPLILSAGFQLNALAGFHEQLTFHAATAPDRTAELRFGAGSLAFPFGRKTAGGTLRLGFESLRTRPTLPADAFPLDTVSRGEEFSASYAQWLRRSRQYNLRLEAGFAAKDGITTLEALPQDLFNPTEDRVRVARLVLIAEGLDRGGAANQASVSWHQGVDVFGASDGRRVSRLTGADGTFTYFQSMLSRVQPLGSMWQLFGRAEGQYSLQPLLPAERFGVGGGQAGRGFPPGNITGDSGAAGTLELRHHVRRWRHAPFQAYGFVDAGWTWNRADARRDSQRLVSGGGGLRLNLGRFFSLNPEIVYRFDGGATDGGDRRTRFHFGVVGRF